MVTMAKKPDPARRKVTMRFRCTEPEELLLKEAARAYGEDFSGWARRILLEAAQSKQGQE